MMRGPQKIATAVRKPDGEIVMEEKEIGKVRKNKILKLPIIRGCVNFFDSMIVGIQSLMYSAKFFDLDEDGNEKQEEPGKFEQWLNKKLGSEKATTAVIYFAVIISLFFSVGLFILLPAVISEFFRGFISNHLAITAIEGGIRIAIFMTYILLVSRMKDIKRVFMYHGAEHKTINCYESGEELTVENVRRHTRLHPRCGTSFLLIVMIISILVFSVASSGLLAAIPALNAMHGTFLYRLIMIVFKLMLLPVVVAFSYEINRWAGRHDNWLTRFMTAPGMWFQNFTTNEPDDSMIEVGIAAVSAVLPEKEGSDRW